MKIICSWCKKEMTDGVIQIKDNKIVTHGICHECIKKTLERDKGVTRFDRR